jgi:pimeloyl-ACP methyl ester carboxylesterase
MESVDTRAGRVTFNERGDGVPLLMLHANLHDHRDFDSIAPRLASRYRTIAVDWPAHGSSTRSPHQAVSAPLFADVLEDIVDALRLERAAFIGNSVGGFAAARLAITRPDRVACLVLVNNGGFVPRNPVTNAFCGVMGSPRVNRRVMPRFVRSYMKPRTTADREIMERTIERARTKEGAATCAALWRSFATDEHDLRDRAEQLRAPTLLVWGAKDTAIPLRAGRATHRAIEGSRFETLDTGHVVFASEPDRFLAIVEPFIAKAAG